MTTDNWQTPCGTNSCFQVRFTPDGHVVIRNSADPYPFIVGTAEEWDALVDAIKAGTLPRSQP